MKKSIVSSALVLLFSTGIFAATPSAPINKSDIQHSIAINGLRSNIGVSVSISGELAQKPYFKVSDMDGHPFYSAKLPAYAGAVKGFDLSQLEEGDYMLTVSAGRQEVKKQVHIYNDEGKKTYFIMQ